MVRGVVGLSALTAALAALPAATAFRIDPPPPMDTRPVWSPDDSAIVFTSGRSSSLRVVSPNGTGDRALPVAYGDLSPDWRWIAFTDYLVNPPRIELVHPDGSARRILVGGQNPDWAPDSERLAFQATEQSGRADVFTMRTDGTELRRIVVDAEVPRWSGDGRWLAFQRQRRPGRIGTDVGIARADGSPPRIVPTRINGGFDATSMEWSPDGATLALFSSSRAGSLYLVRTRDLRVRRVRLPVRARGGEWSPDGRSIAYEGEGIWRLDVRSGRSTRLARFGGGPDWSRSGRSVAFGGGGRCGDRSGVYRVAATGGRLVRLTNDCRVVGSDGPNTLTGGEFADVLIGGDGDDVLIAHDDFYYEGDRLEGGPGNDRLVGSDGTNVLVGGAGRDVIDGGAAHDRVLALDGERDVIACGGPPRTGRIGDVVYADRADVVARDCEFVFRSGTPVRTSFSIIVWPRGKPGPSRHWNLACEPARGTLPARERACATLANLLDPFGALPDEAVCRAVPAQAAIAQLDGMFRGRRFLVRLNRLDGCEIGRWDRLGFLFPALP